MDTLTPFPHLSASGPSYPLHSFTKTRCTTTFVFVFMSDYPVFFCGEVERHRFLLSFHLFHKFSFCLDGPPSFSVPASISSVTFHRRTKSNNSHSGCKKIRYAIVAWDKKRKRKEKSGGERRRRSEMHVWRSWVQLGFGLTCESIWCSVQQEKTVIFNILLLFFFLRYHYKGIFSHMRKYYLYLLVQKFGWPPWRDMRNAMAIDDWFGVCYSQYKMWLW